MMTWTMRALLVVAFAAAEDLDSEATIRGYCANQSMAVSSIAGVQIDGASLTTSPSDSCDGGDSYKVAFIATIATAVPIALVALAAAAVLKVRRSKMNPAGSSSKRTNLEFSKKQITLRGAHGAGSTRSPARSAGSEAL